MRPEIPEPLAERISNIYEQSGYANRGELVRDAVRHRLRDLEEEVDATGDPLDRDAVIHEEGGIAFGANPNTDEEIVINRFTRPVSPNMFVAGDIGSGKSASVKAQLVREARQRDDLNVVLIDPLNGFVGLNEALGGTRVVVGSNAGINPLEIRETPAEVRGQIPEHDHYAEKIQQVLAFLDAYRRTSDGETLTEEKRGVVERAIEQAYADRGITRDPATHSRESPTFEDVLDVLTDIARNPSDHTNTSATSHAERLAEIASKLVVQLYPLTDGKDDNFACSTEIEIDTPVTYFDLHQQAGHGYTDLMMQLVFATAYERAKQLDGQTIIVVDEVQYLLETKAGSQVVETALRHSRHHGVGFVLSCQTPSEVIGTDVGQAIVDNCSLVQLHHAETLSEEAADALRLPEGGQQYVRTASPGVADAGHTEALLGVDGDWLPMDVTLTEAERAIVDFDSAEDDPADLPDVELGGE